MVTAALEGPGIRLGAEELMALRASALRVGRAKPATRKPGAVAGKPPGAGMDLREIRAFAEGDDARRIDAAATARTGTPHVRSFHEDRDDTVVLIADFRPAMLWGTASALRSVAGARLLARRGWQAIARGASVGAVAVTAAGTANLSGRTGVAQMIAIARMLAGEHDLALRTGGGDRSLVEGLVRAHRAAPPGAEVLIATGPDGVAPDDEPALARLARRRRVRILLPLDPVETSPPAGGLSIRSGASTRHARLRALDTAALALRFGRLNVAFEAVADDAG